MNIDSIYLQSMKFITSGSLLPDCSSWQDKSILWSCALTPHDDATPNCQFVDICQHFDKITSMEYTKHVYLTPT